NHSQAAGVRPTRLAVRTPAYSAAYLARVPQNIEVIARPTVADAHVVPPVTSALTVVALVGTGVRIGVMAVIIVSGRPAGIGRRTRLRLNTEKRQKPGQC